MQFCNETDKKEKRWIIGVEDFSASCTTCDIFSPSVSQKKSPADFTELYYILKVVSTSFLFMYGHTTHQSGKCCKIVDILWETTVRNHPNNIPGVPPKSTTLDFHYFYIRKYSIFWFHQIKYCLLKRMIPRSLKLVEYFWFYGHFSKHSHCQFSLHSHGISGRDKGFSDFHTLLPGSPLISANKTKRKLMDCYTRRK